MPVFPHLLPHPMLVPIFFLTSCQVFPSSSSPHARFSHIFPHLMPIFPYFHLMPGFPIVFLTSCQVLPSSCSCQFSRFIFHLMPIFPYYFSPHVSFPLLHASFPPPHARFSHHLHLLNWSSPDSLLQFWLASCTGCPWNEVSRFLWVCSPAPFSLGALTVSTCLNSEKCFDFMHSSLKQCLLLNML